MKLDFDLARAILLAIEVDDDATGHGWITLGSIEGFSQEEVSYHVQLLHEAGLVEAVNLSESLKFYWEPLEQTFL